MPVRRRFLGHPPRCAAPDGHGVDDRFVISLRIIADGKQVGSGRDAMIIVAAGGEPGIELNRIVAVHRQALDVPITIEEERTAIAGPVGCFEATLRKISDAAVGRINGNSFERTVEDRLLWTRTRSSQLNLGEDRLLQHVFIMRANTQTYITCAL